MSQQPAYEQLWGGAQPTTTHRDPGFWRPLAIGSLVVNGLVLCCGIGAMAVAGFVGAELADLETEGRVVITDGEMRPEDLAAAATEFLEQGTLGYAPDDLTCGAILEIEVGATSLCEGTDARVLVRVVGTDGAVEFFERL